jgi:hypothetical protein
MSQNVPVLENDFSQVPQRSHAFLSFAVYQGRKPSMSQNVPVLEKNFSQVP